MPVGRPFPKGVSANPGARRSLRKKARALLKGHESDWATSLVEDMTGKPGAERSAAQRLYASYRWGKPAEAVELDAGGAISLNIIIPGEREP